MPDYIVLLGPPGAGKGTQAQLVSEEIGLPHISSGDIFRENFKRKTELGQKAEGYIIKGELVPDDLTISMISERLSRSDCKSGALLDGFPRTRAQAETFDAMLAGFSSRVRAVPYLNVRDEVLIERLAGRWICRACGHVFHEKFTPPKEAGICDFCGSELYQREDDKIETVTQRIRVYKTQTQPLIDYYQDQGTLLEVDGAQSIEKVSEALMAALAGED